MRNCISEIYIVSKKRQLKKIFGLAKHFIQIYITRWIRRFDQTHRILTLLQVMRLWSTEGFRTYKVAHNSGINFSHLQTASPRHQCKRLQNGNNIRLNDKNHRNLLLLLIDLPCLGPTCSKELSHTSTNMSSQVSST